MESVCGVVSIDWRWRRPVVSAVSESRVARAGEWRLAVATRAGARALREPILLLVCLR